jgi:flagellar motility protein MotE (MotC chaperone)
MSRVKGWINKVRPGTFQTEQTTTIMEETPEKTFTEAERKVLTSLAQREEELRKKEELYKQKAAELKTLSQQTEQKLDQIKKLVAEFERKRQLRKEMDEKDITRMVRYYEIMDPELTVTFFNDMDRVTAAQILLRMNPRKAAAIWELLEPKIAIELTEMVTRFKADRSQVEEVYNK